MSWSRTAPFIRWPSAPAARASCPISSPARPERTITAGLGPDRAQLRRRLEPVHPAHENVHEDDVRQAGEREIDPLLAARGDADDLDPLVALEEHPQRVCEQLLVIDHEDSDERAG
jgi:hypothetical protein